MTSFFVAVIAIVLCQNLVFCEILSGTEGPTEVKGSSHMETSFSLDEKGILTAKTRTWSTHKLKGFTGGVFVALLDGEKNVKWTSEQHQYGVNGKWLGNSDRTETWTEQVPVEMLSQIKFYSIMHQHTPTNRVWDWVKDHKEELLIVAKVIVSSG